MSEARSGPVRNFALDFTKGMLVLLMILYHWYNYFVSVEGNIYKYLRFITPSFIFIAGFLIANVYLMKYQVSDPRLRTRLFVRGLKLLVIFTVLNVAASLVSSERSSIIGNAWSVYVTGNGKAAAFWVLVPISYVLLLCAGLLYAWAWYKNLLRVMCGILFLAIYLLYLNNMVSNNLELLAIGLFGVVVGYVPIQKANVLGSYLWVIMLAYIPYLAGITILDVIYPLQVVGVILSLMIIYGIGLKVGEKGVIQNRILVLGKYTLFGYIVQIALLQLLRKELLHLDIGDGSIALSFFLSFALTIIAVETVVWVREKSMVVDRLYRSVFM